MLEKIGLEKERLEICNLATNSGVRLAETLHRKSEQLRKLGPNTAKV
jgi:coenzyme F420-reducing hydrogenase delta subunit